MLISRSRRKQRSSDVSSASSSSSFGETSSWRWSHDMAAMGVLGGTLADAMLLGGSSCAARAGAGKGDPAAVAARGVAYAADESAAAGASNGSCEVPHGHEEMDDPKWYWT